MRYINTQELKDQRILQFKKALKDMIATSKAAYVRSDAKSYRERNPMYSKEEIKRTLGITKENRSVILTYENDSIVIKKDK